ncbi:MAG: hypothetical protein R3223_02320 [Longimicrobiales bacterium]|nr:hypothetical protein [Longimicrobiales bacterium]
MTPEPAATRRLCLVGSLTALVFSGCAWNTAGSTSCTLDRAPVALAPGLGESSGLAPAGSPDPGASAPFFWTHNDSGSEPVLYRVSSDGSIADSVRVVLSGGSARDLEALERASCVEGLCLYLADVGDNEERRDDAALYRFPEPDPGVGSATAMALPIRFPDGPTDVEALFVLPGDRIFLVSKGRSRPVTVYRYPLPLRPGKRVTLERVQALTRESPFLPRYVTGASAMPGGLLVAVRTYESLHFYRVEEDRLVPVPGGKVILRTLREAQGEAVASLPDGRLLLTSEAGPLGRRGGLVTLRCPQLISGGREVGPTP